MSHRDAIRIPIQDADSAFGSLADMVDALAGAADQRPQDTAFAIAQLKKYLPDPVHRIKLHDLMAAETGNVVNQCRNLTTDGEFGYQRYAERMRQYEEASARLLKLLTIGAFFSDCDEHDRLWSRCIEQLATRTMNRSGLIVLNRMQHYPTLLALYTIALGAVAANRLEPIAIALGSIKVQESGRQLPIVASANSWEVLDGDIVKGSIAELGMRKTPVSDHLLDALRPVVSEIIKDEERLEDYFDEAEYLMGLSYASLYGHGRGPVGRASWRKWQTEQYLGSVDDRHKELLIREGALEDNGQLSEVRETYDNLIRSSYWPS